MAVVGQVLYPSFETYSLTTSGTAAPDALPTAVLIRNGVELSTTLTVTPRGTGRYSVRVPISGGDGWTVGDSYGVEVHYLMGGVQIDRMIAQDFIQSWNVATGGDGNYTKYVVASLGAQYTGKGQNVAVAGVGSPPVPGDGTLGYRLFDINNVIVQTFTVVNVWETFKPGDYMVVGGITKPIGSYRIEWGTAATKLAHDVLEPPPTLTSMIASIASSVASAVWGYVSRTLSFTPSNLANVVTTPAAKLDWEVPIGCTVDFDITVPDVDGVVQDITNWDIYCTAKDRFSTADGGAGQLFQLAVGSGIVKDPLGLNEKNKFRVTIGSSLTKNLPFTEKQYEVDIKVSIHGSPNDPRLLGSGALTTKPTVTRAGTP